MKPILPAWDDPPDIILPPDLHAVVGGNELVAQVLARRGLITPAAALAFLDPAEYAPASPFVLPGMQQAVERLQHAVLKHEHICVWGDFDVDGQTATTLLVSGLRDLGAVVTYHIPVRANESHGVNLPALSRLIDDGAQLLLTCDTGIAAHEAALLAAGRGVDMIITDHHDLPLSPAGEPLLPQALSVINPKLLPTGHPLGTLPGVGVAYKLIEALYQAPSAPHPPDVYLDLVALGIVADLAILSGDTRYLLQRGLRELRENRRVGLQAILKLANLDPANLSEEHIGYVLGPRMNAIGRLGDANPVVELLSTGDVSIAERLALELEALNARRKYLTDQVFQAARESVEKEPAQLDEPALVLANPEWPAGVIGIVASRLVDHYHKPAVLLAAPYGEPARGSARSVVGVNITAALAANAELLLQFGGHPMAAGFSILPENVPAFRQALLASLRSEQGPEQPGSSLSIDAYVPLAGINLELVAQLERLAPFGPGNRLVTLASRNLQLTGYNAIGQNEEHMLLTVGDESGSEQRVVWWQGAGWPIPEGRFDLAYSARASNYRGRREVQVTWLDWRPAAQDTIHITAGKPEAQVFDFRQDANPLASLQRLLAEEEMQVWREGSAVDRMPGQDRYELAPCQSLVIWTLPPGRAELQTALERAAPQRVYLFANDPGLDMPELFLKRLAGLVKYVLRTNQGRVRLTALAAATAQREATVLAGLDWLVVRGYILWLERDMAELHLAEGPGVLQSNADLPARYLKDLLDETRAFRAYYKRVSPRSLLD